MAKVVVVCGIVAMLGITSTVAGFAAEATRIKASDVYIKHFSCVYPSSPALGLGILAIVCTIATQIILLIVAGCCCRPSGSTSIPIYSVINILSWIASVGAVILFIGGVVLNNRRGGQKIYNDWLLKCYVVKPGIFASGAIISLLGSFFGIVAYTSTSSSTQMTSQLDVELPVAGDVDIEKTSVHPQPH